MAGSALVVLSTVACTPSESLREHGSTLPSAEEPPAHESAAQLDEPSDSRRPPDSGEVVVAGIVLTPDGRPAAGIRMWASTIDAELGAMFESIPTDSIYEGVAPLLALQGRWTYADDDGGFEIGRLDPGLVLIGIVSDQYFGRWGPTALVGGTRLADVRIRLAPMELPFDRSLWRQQRDGGHASVPHARSRMIRDLEENHLPGLSRDEVRELLGEPEKLGGWSTGQYPAGTWAYWLSDAFLVDSWWLIVVFDENDQVLRTDRYQD